ncbi:hypothetical protein Sinac_0728 [Singulisphaera acidiphila DSM 18658]|uniref:Uncharacterized protein n=1 Tax=Singulisphaera acidiphila (strain ATCC BAA-1392 / DSM 18658 / VKM B-2454 / MOB10) TaxID=886293 RepID=L0D8H5_SINAD|nr:hypothetical protein Sinac_0728 [Singulisphaera acidiphila DSM 18658]
MVVGTHFKGIIALVLPPRPFERPRIREERRQDLSCRWRIISGIQGKRTWMGAAETQKKKPARSPICDSMSSAGGSGLACWVGDHEADGKPAVEMVWGCWFGRRVWLGLVSSVELNAWAELARHRRQRSSGPWRPIRRTDTLEIRSGVRLLPLSARCGLMRPEAETMVGRFRFFPDEPPRRPPGRCPNCRRLTLQYESPGGDLPEPLPHPIYRCLGCGQRFWRLFAGRWGPISANEDGGDSSALPFPAQPLQPEEEPRPRNRVGARWRFELRHVMYLIAWISLNLATCPRVSWSWESLLNLTLLLLFLNGALVLFLRTTSRLSRSPIPRGLGQRPWP